MNNVFYLFIFFLMSNSLFSMQHNNEQEDQELQEALSLSLLTSEQEAPYKDCNQEERDDIALALALSLQPEEHLAEEEQFQIAQALSLSENLSKSLGIQQAGQREKKSGVKRPRDEEDDSSQAEKRQSSFLGITTGLIGDTLSSISNYFSGEPTSYQIPPTSLTTTTTTTNNNTKTTAQTLTTQTAQTTTVQTPTKQTTTTPTTQTSSTEKTAGITQNVSNNNVTKKLVIREYFCLLDKDILRQRSNNAIEETSCGRFVSFFAYKLQSLFMHKQADHQALIAAIRGFAQESTRAEYQNFTQRFFGNEKTKPVLLCNERVDAFVQNLFSLLPREQQADSLPVVLTFANAGAEEQYYQLTKGLVSVRQGGQELLNPESLDTWQELLNLLLRGQLDRNGFIHFLVRAKKEHWTYIGFVKTTDDNYSCIVADSAAGVNAQRCQGVRSSLETIKGILGLL